MLIRFPRIKVLGVFLTLSLFSSCSFSNTIARPQAEVGRANFSVPFQECGLIECGEISVPLDYENLSSGRLDLAVYRRRSTNQKEHNPVLLVHPGGPGGDVKRTVSEIVSLLGESANKFDVVGLATRASQDVLGANCGHSLDDFEKAIDVPSLAKKVASGCEKYSRQLINASGTRDSVEDIEQLRRLLNVDKFSFLGWSYGATLGAALVMMYPASVAAVVLDAPSDPREPWATSFRLESKQQRENIVNATLDCDQLPECPLGDSSLQRIRTIQDKLLKHPLLIGSGSQEVTARSIAMAMELASYSGDYRALFSMIAGVGRGDGLELFRFAQSRLGRNERGDDEGGMETQTIVRCSDISHADASDVVSADNSMNQRVPVIGIGAVIERICLSLPESSRPLRSLRVDEKAIGARVLVITTSHDAVMPSQISRRLSEDMKWAYLTRQGSRHLSVGNDPVGTRRAVACLLQSVCQ